MSISQNDQIIFSKACKKIIYQERKQQGIGTLSEKTLHAVLKNFYEPDENFQEIPVGRYVADILRDNEIIEIQTRSFQSLRKKLNVFLPRYPVTIVYPILHNKWLSWINNETGEISQRRKSPKHGQIYDIVPELYRIKPYLSEPNLHLCPVFLDVEEYRILNGWNDTKKKGSTRFDRIPTALIDEIYIGSPKDYQCFIPDKLPSLFTSLDFSQNAHISRGISQTLLGILLALKQVERVGKRGNTYLYSNTIDKTKLP